MSKHTIAFMHQPIDGAAPLYFAPAIIVDDLGWADFFMMGERSFDLIEKEANAIKEAHDFSVQKSMGITLHYYIKALSAGLVEKYTDGEGWNASALSALKSYLLNECEFDMSRPLHYRTHGEQVVFYAMVHVKDEYPQYLPVLCDPIATSDIERFTVVNSVDEAVSQVQGLDVPGALVNRGHYACYGGYFGANPHLMFKYCAPKLVLGEYVFDVFEDVYEELRERRSSRYILDLKNAILNDPAIKKAGFTDLINKEGKVLASVPTLPLVCWTCFMAGQEDSTPDYRPYSPRGLKEYHDNPYHTEWMVGGGIDLEKDYHAGSEIQKAAFAWSQNYQKFFFGFEHQVLSSGPVVSGRIRFATDHNAHEIKSGDIVVIPSAGPKYQLHVEQACRNGKGGVIAINGHKGTHLAVVGRERGLTIFRIEDAASRFVEGLKVLLDPRHGTVHFVESDS